VIDAAEAALFVPPEEERNASVGALLVEDANATLVVAEGDEVFAQ